VVSKQLRMERERRNWDEHVTGMDAESLVKISRDHVAARRFPGRPKDDEAIQSQIKTEETAYNEEEEELMEHKTNKDI